MDLDQPGGGSDRLGSGALAAVRFLAETIPPTGHRVVDIGGRQVPARASAARRRRRLAATSGSEPQISPMGDGPGPEIVADISYGITGPGGRGYPGLTRSAVNPVHRYGCRRP